MNLTGALLTLGGVYLAFQGFRFLSVKDMSFSLATVNASQQGLTTNVTLNININNPSNWSNTLDGLDGDIYANGTFIGHASVLGPIVIPAYAGKDFSNPPAKVDINLNLADLSLAAIIFSIFAGSTTQAMVNFQGHVLADSIPIKIPLNLTYQVV